MTRKHCVSIGFFVLTNCSNLNNIYQNTLINLERTAMNYCSCMRRAS